MRMHACMHTPGSRACTHLLACATPQAVVSLPVQYRMAADIMELPNELIYGRALRCGTGAWVQRERSGGSKRRRNACVQGVHAVPVCGRFQQWHCWQARGPKCPACA